MGLLADILTKKRHEPSLIIGDKKAVSALETKEHARLLVVSDSHGNTERFISIVKRYGSTCDALLFCGDGLSDIAGMFSAAHTDKELERNIPPVLAFAQGNCDPRNVPGGLVAHLEQSLTVNGHKILIVHGHAHGVDYGLEKLGLQMRLNGYDIAFYGHTHIASEKRIENTAGDSPSEFKFVNPGSCARPRGGQPASLAIATVEKTFIDIAFINAETFELWTPIT